MPVITADYERQALYDWIGVHKGRGYIAGNNRLVPTHGTTNPAVVYYMAYYLYHTYEAGGRVIASFHGRKKRNFQVVIDTGYTLAAGRGRCGQAPAGHPGLADAQLRRQEGP